ncbi:MAG: Ig-like domain-containing protein [Deltaproteobacteria bacterium]|nr:Ig-like domain-containing protein [Deltaproteobacteria bacterium]
MRVRLGFLLVLAACNSGSSSDPNGSNGDGGVGGDGGEEDSVAPHVIAVTPAPGGDAWLHGPIRFTFDEPIVAPALTVTATLGNDPVEATVAVGTDGRSVLVTIDPAVRGVGELAVQIDGEVVDRAGNASEDDLSLTASVTPWSPIALDRGVASGVPAITVGKDGSVLAAWIVGPPSAHRVVVAGHGGELGASNVTSVAIGLDADERPVVAYVDGGQANVLGWVNDAWIPLFSAPATKVALANEVDAPLLAVASGSSVTVHTLVTGSWQTVGTALSTAGAPTDLAIARGAVAWVDPSGAQVHRLVSGSWQALAPIAGANRISVATRAQTVAVAWEQYSGSDGVYAATANAGETTWTRLGGLLDVDPNSDARAPQIAIDSAGAPIITWSESIEGTARGVTAAWAGDAWKILGGHSWLAATAMPAGSRMLLGAGRAPVVAWTAGGTLGIARFNGPREAAAGPQTRASIAGCSFSASSPPSTVLATGCFTLTAPGKVAPHAGMVPYDLMSELWTDGTKKRRWFALPDGAVMSDSATGAWSASTGAVIIKEFAVETTPGDATTRKAVETRFLVMTASGWQGFTYKWRQDGSNADLMSDGQSTAAWSTTAGTYTHYYPSRSQCLSCHESSFGPMLGPRPEQLKRWFDYDGVIAEQLPTLVQLGVGPTSTAAPLPSPHDASLSVERRTRGYMAANCAHCHNPNHISIKDLRFTTPLAQTRLCEVIVPGRPLNSRLHQLVTQRPGMPALGSLVPDPLIGSLISSWITDMTSCP